MLHCFKTVSFCNEMYCLIPYTKNRAVDCYITQLHVYPDFMNFDIVTIVTAVQWTPYAAKSIATLILYFCSTLEFNGILLQHCFLKWYTIHFNALLIIFFNYRYWKCRISIVVDAILSKYFNATLNSIELVRY